MKNWFNLVKFLVLIFIIYLIAISLWGGFFEIPHMRSKGPNAIVHNVVFTSDQIEHFNHLLDVAEFVNIAASLIFVILCLISLAIGSLYWLNRRKPANILVQSIKANRKRLKMFIGAVIALFIAVTIAIPSYPMVYLLKIQNDNFIQELHSLRN
jgi:hypothetical protein